jgi:hypothetical protein
MAAQAQDGLARELRLELAAGALPGPFRHGGKDLPTKSAFLRFSWK